MKKTMHGVKKFQVFWPKPHHPRASVHDKLSSKYWPQLLSESCTIFEGESCNRPRYLQRRSVSPTFKQGNVYACINQNSMKSIKMNWTVGVQSQKSFWRKTKFMDCSRACVKTSLNVIPSRTMKWLSQEKGRLNQDAIEYSNFPRNVWVKMTVYQENRLCQLTCPESQECTTVQTS